MWLVFFWIGIVLLAYCGIAGTVELFLKQSRKFRNFGDETKLPFKYP